MSVALEHRPRRRLAVDVATPPARASAAAAADRRVGSAERDARPLMFAYWGTRGALPQLTWQLACVARQRAVPCTFAVSDTNELIEGFPVDERDLFLVKGSCGSWRRALSPARVQALRRNLRDRLSADRTRAVVTLLPHVWSPFLVPVLRRAGVRQVTIVHEVDGHPGDRLAMIDKWLSRAATDADHIVTLSQVVAERLIAAHRVSEQKISVLFHPDLTYCQRDLAVRESRHPLRILFFGRILPYKGLDLFVDAAENLRGQGVDVHIGVFGEGRIDRATRVRLQKLGAEVENCWIPHSEIGKLFSRYDLLIAAHREASQSGVVATAFGAGLPVVATPVGGLREQVLDGVTGVVAAAATAEALAEAIRGLAENHHFVARLKEGVATTRGRRSIERFFDAIVGIAWGRRTGGEA